MKDVRSDMLVRGISQNVDEFLAILNAEHDTYYYNEIIKVTVFHDAEENGQRTVELVLVTTTSLYETMVDSFLKVMEGGMPLQDQTARLHLYVDVNSMRFDEHYIFDNGKKIRADRQSDDEPWLKPYSFSGF